VAQSFALQQEEVLWKDQRCTSHPVWGSIVESSQSRVTSCSGGRGEYERL